VSGLPAGVNGTYAGGVITITGTPTVAGHFIYTVNATGPCLPASIGGTIDVTADATNTLTSAPATANQTLCINTAITNITYAIGGSGTGATVTGLPAGVNGVYAGGVVTISGTPTVPGTFNYTVTPVGPCFKPALTGQILVNQDGIITQTSAPATANQEICKNTAFVPITFTITGGGTGASVSPALPAGVTGTYAGGVFTISGTPTVAVTTPTIYTITTTGGFCVQNSRTVTLTVNELPTPDFTFSSPLCQTRTVTFTDASIANSGVLDQFNWTFGDATSGTGTPVSHAYATSGVKNVTLQVHTTKGCFNTISHAVTINENPKADFTVPEACISDNVNFPDISTAPAGNPLTQWEWNFDDPGSGGSNTQVYNTPGPGTHIFSTTGIHNVRLIVTSSTGCKDTIFHNIDINGVPTSSYTLSNTTNQCSSDTVYLTNTSTVSYGTILRQEIYWDNIGAPGTFIAEPSPAVGNIYKHKYPTLQTTQTYEIKVRSYSGTTCFDDEIRTLTVYATPKVQFNNMPDVCYDAAPFQITQASEIGGVPGTASYTGPGVSPTGIFTPSVAGIGTHIIKYTFTATAGGCIDTLSKTIRVRDTATANFAPAAIRCEKSAIQFTDNSSIPAGEGTITGWSWNFGDPASGANNTSNAQNPTHTYAAYGSYTVTLTVQTSNGCFSTQRVNQVNVDPLPAPGFAFDKPSYCIPNAIVTFSNSSTIPSSSALSYTWDFGDLTTGSGPTPSHQYTAIGPFNVTLTATSAENCSNTITIPLTTIHPQPKADFATSKPAVCIGDAVTFTDLSDGKDGVINQWNWNFGDAQTAITNPVTHLYATAQDYNVSLYTVNSQGCNSDTITRVFTVDPFPVVNAGPDRFMLEGGQITLEPQVTGAHLEFLWTPNVSMSNNRVMNPVIRNLTGDITYRLTVTAKGGCVASDEVFVKLLRAPKIPNTFTPNNDGINDTWRIDYLNTYPNNRVQIFTRTGQKVFESRGYTKPWDGTLNGKPLPIDTYYYIIEPNNGRDPITGYVTILK
jgi:gliding motility-associated-like protein